MYRTDGCRVTRRHARADEGPQKVYWLLVGHNMNPRGEPYIFGNENAYFALYNTALHKETFTQIEKIAECALLAHNIKIPPTHGAFIVLCRYPSGVGVGNHQDTDYENGGFPYVVSMSPCGIATMKVSRAKNGPHHSILLMANSMVVFDAAIWHSVQDSALARLNITVRYALRGAQVFKKPAWFSEMNEIPRDGDTQTLESVRNPPS